MFFSGNLLEEIKAQKYYSKPRKCTQCGKTKQLNYVTELCDECSKIYFDFLHNEIQK